MGIVTVKGIANNAIQQANSKRANWRNMTNLKTELTMKKIALLWVCVLTVIGSLSTRADQEGPYTYVLTNGQAIITGFDRNYSGTLVVTHALGGYPVTTIGDEAFAYCRI